MHELAITKSIFSIVEKHALKNKVQKVLFVNLEIGSLSDLEGEWIQHYFDYLSDGTLMAGARLLIKKIPAVFRCNDCNELFTIYSLLQEKLNCKQCQSGKVTLVSGKEFTIKNIGVQ